MLKPLSWPLAAILATMALAGPARADALVAYTVKNGGIDKPLTTTPGNPAQGRKIVADQDRGGCLSCHAVPMPEEDFQGQIGPDLAGVGKRLKPRQLRLRLVDAKQINTETVMPAFYKTEGLSDVAKAVEGKPILSAQDVEDVVAYLATLK